MDQFNILTKIFMVLSLMLPQISPRHYDVEADALRLYGEDLRSVLLKFRRSSDYMQLLSEKFQDLFLFLNEVAVHAKQYVVENKLRKKIAEVCGIDSEPPVARSYSEFHSRRDGSELLNISISPVAHLDYYVQDRGIMSAQERNHIRDVAFEQAGQTIHMIIKSFGPSEISAWSTRLPFGGEPGEVITTTEKDHRHSIATGGIFDFTTKAQSTNHAPIESYVDKTLRGYKLYKP